jgi:hypothetical protein
VKKRKRGGQPGNQNAAGKRGRKEYRQIFGQRWSIEVGKKILAYLKRTGQSQKQYLDKQVERDILNEEDGQGDV